jgi:hypothetical protein
MADVTAQRTLVKSPPELWSELSETERLAKHLGAFGEIKITKLEAERTVAWEGETASGTVSIEPSGWGTKVTLTAQVEEAAEPQAPKPEAAEPEAPAAVAEPEPEPPAAHAEAEPELAAPEPEPEPEPSPERQGFFTRLFRRRKREATQADGPTDEPAPNEEQPAEGPAAEAPVEEPATAEEQPVAEPAVEEPPASEPVSASDSPAPDSDTHHETLDGERAQDVLEEALEALGSAHHRPFSRA